MTYTNVYRTYHNDVRAATDVRVIETAGILKGIGANLLAKGALRVPHATPKIPPWGVAILNNPFNAKVISYIDSDGYPIILPCLQLRAVDPSRLIFPFTQFNVELNAIPLNSHISIFGLVAANQELINIMVNGNFNINSKNKGN